MSQDYEKLDTRQDLSTVNRNIWKEIKDLKVYDVGLLLRIRLDKSER